MLRLLTVAATLWASTAIADVEKTRAEGDVATVMGRLESAVLGAGATIFARVDHGGGAESVGWIWPIPSY